MARKRGMWFRLLVVVVMMMYEGMKRVGKAMSEVSDEVDD